MLPKHPINAVVLKRKANFYGILGAELAFPKYMAITYIFIPNYFDLKLHNVHAI